MSEEEKTFVEIESMLGRKFEPKRRCRWIVKIDGIDPFLAMKASRPRVLVTGAQKTYCWMNVELYDPIAPTGAGMIWEWLQQNEPREVKLQVLDPVGTIVEEWQISNATIAEADFGELSYASAEPATIKVALSYEKCELKF